MRALPLLWVLACQGEGYRGQSDGVPSAPYAGLSEGASWTWALSPGEELPAEDELVRGRVEGDEIILRQGARYADGLDWGSLRLTTEEGLTLRAWDLDGDSGQRPLLLCPADLEQGSRIEQGSWSCEAALWTPQETFFGTFERALVLTCEGSGPAGTWAFAEDVGLIYLQTGDVELSLVAPW